jgi:hypothetical protein
MVGGLVCQTVEKMWNRWFLKATSLQSTSRTRRLEERESYGPSICHHALEMGEGGVAEREGCLPSVQVRGDDCLADAADRSTRSRRACLG